jgi:hypothetical protein
LLAPGRGLSLSSPIEVVAGGAGFRGLIGEGLTLIRGDKTCNAKPIKTNQSISASKDEQKLMWNSLPWGVLWQQQGVETAIEECCPIEMLFDVLLPSMVGAAAVKIVEQMTNSWTNTPLADKFFLIVVTNQLTP